MRYTTIPRRAVFERDTNARNVFLKGKFDQDRLFKAILKLLGAVERQADFVQLGLLGNLYFTTENWLSAPGNRGRGRYPKVQALFEVTVKTLCRHFDTTPNVLPQHLINQFGQTIDPDPYAADLTAKAVFLSRAAALKQQVIFSNAKAYSLNWWSGPPLRRVRVNTADITSPGVISPGLSGYALTMDRRLILGKHAETAHDANGVMPHTKFAHSAYTGGKPVLCAGEIGIVNGTVVVVSNGSGHYKPPAEKLQSVIELLQANGVDLRRLLVQVNCGSAGTVTCWASQYLSSPSGQNLQSISGQAQRSFYLEHWGQSYYEMARAHYIAQGIGRLSDAEIDTAFQ